MPDRKRILVIGSTGHFGARLCRRLVGEPNTELIVTSRSRSGAEAQAKALRLSHPDATVSPLALDQSSPRLLDDLKACAPDIVVHTAGPYQGQDYRVAEACIQCGSHYLDLADGREFVQGFGRLHEAAQRRGVLLVTGASTLPGLSSAVVDSLRDRFTELHEIAISIAPAHQTPRGTGTVAAVLSYCGKPFQVLVNGDWVRMHGWQNMRSQRYPALGFRLSAACDVPDLALLPAYVPAVRTVTFHAALEAKWEQVALWLMGGMTRLRLVGQWDRLVPAFRWLSGRLVHLGSDTGGMQVRLSGLDADRRDSTVIWDLTARQNHGPEIPCTPALILTRKLVRDELALRGAVPCLGLITLAEFDAEVKDLGIDWIVDETA